MTGSIGFAAALENDADYFVAALYDTSNIGVCLESQLIPKGSGYPTPPDPFSVTFLTNLQQNHVYRCILWESPNNNNTPAGISVVSGDFKASTNSVTFRTDLYLIGGTSAGMTTGASGYVDPTNSLAGWTYDLEQVGYGTLQQGVGDYTLDSNSNWTLINGTAIGDGQKFVIHFQPQIAQAAPPPVSSISSGQILGGAGMAMPSTLKNQALYIQGTSTSMFFTLPALSNIADYDRIVIQCSGGIQINAQFVCQGADKIQYGARKLTQLVLAQGENLTLCKANGVYNVENAPLVGVDRVGEVVYKWTKNDTGLMMLDGTEKNPNDYARLYQWLTSGNVETDAICSEAVWPTVSTLDGITYYSNKGKWTLGDGASFFRVPLVLNSFFRNADGVTRGPGSFQADAVLDHQHSTSTGLIPGAPNGEGPTLASNGRYNNQQNQPSDLTGHPYNPTGAGEGGVLTARIDSETRPANIALYACIRF